MILWYFESIIYMDIILFQTMYNFFRYWFFLVALLWWLNPQELSLHNLSFSSTFEMLQNYPLGNLSISLFKTLLYWDIFYNNFLSITAKELNIERNTRGLKLTRQVVNEFTSVTLLKFSVLNYFIKFMELNNNIHALVIVYVWVGRHLTTARFIWPFKL